MFLSPTLKRLVYSWSMDNAMTGDASRKHETGSNGRVKAAAWTAGLTAFCSLAVIDDSPTWPVAFAVASVIAMVAFVCHTILYYR
jgi:hypothetical protein